MKFRPMTILPWCLVAVLMCVAMSPKPQSDLVLQSPNGKNTITLSASDGGLMFRMSDGEQHATISINDDGFAGMWLAGDADEPFTAMYRDPSRKHAVIGVYRDRKIQEHISAVGGN